MQIKDYSADRYASVEPGWLRDARDTKEELPFRRAEDLAHKLNMSASQFGVRLLDISPSTVRRRRHNNKLTPGESTKVLRYFHIQRLATGLMEGDETAARQWLFSPLAILGGDPPLEHARTEVGAREVEQLIGRIEHGVYC